MLAGLLLTACLPTEEAPAQEQPTESAFTATPEPTLLPTREPYQPGELVDYTVQSGDTMPALAAHFNTTELEIRAANPNIPETTTTLPQGMPMKIPIYYQALWGNPYQIIPDWYFVNGPAQVDFDTVAFVNSQPGWLKDYSEYASGDWRTGGQLIDLVATNFSVSPRLLLALVEYQAHALSNPGPIPSDPYPLGYEEMYHRGLYLQLVWAANTMNNGYYGWRTGSLREFDRVDGSLEIPDPWQNAATVGIQYYFAQLLGTTDYQHAIYSDGLARSYRELFGDPWENVGELFPVSLEQPALTLPFASGVKWAYTGGPHTGWGENLPYAALDFAPPAVVGGCTETTEYATAVADGVIARTGNAIAVLDLDGDGDERTGWVIFYLHLANRSLPAVGAHFSVGDPIGLPSCEGGNATGTHVHIARKYNGEWVSAGGALAFNLEGWIAANGSEPYLGTLNRNGRVISACVCSDAASQIESRPQQ